MGTMGQEQLAAMFADILGAFTLACGALCATPPTSIVGALLWTGYLGQVLSSHLGVAGLACGGIVFALVISPALWGALRLRDTSPRVLLP